MLPTVNLGGGVDYRRALEQIGEIDSFEKVKLQKEILLEKWSGNRAGKHNPDLDWLGDRSVERGFPALRNDEEKAVVAILLENQFQFQKSKEARIFNGRVILQDTTTADEALPTRYALPIIRRVYALMQRNDWSTTQPLPGPSGFVFWLDFLREADANPNLLYGNPYALAGGELSVPKKGKLALLRKTLEVTKQILGVTWSLESLEDARAQLGLDVENELLVAFAQEFTRELYGRHLGDIVAAASTGVETGLGLPAPWSGANTDHVIPAKGSESMVDYKSIMYNSLLDADTDFQKRNRIPSDAIICGYGLAGFLRKMFTATGSTSVDDTLSSTVGLTNYGTYEGRWTIWGTDFVDDNRGFLYRKNPEALHTAHIYAPYVPVQVMPAVYGDYDPDTGNYQNRDAWTRNIRERSASLVTRPSGFQPIRAANLSTI